MSESNSLIGLLTGLAALDRATQHRLATAILARRAVHGESGPAARPTGGKPRLDRTRRAAGPDLVRLSDREPGPSRSQLYGSPLWAALYEGGDEVHVYVAQCDGVQAIARLINDPMAKVGTCRGGDLDRRLRNLGQQNYASVYADPRLGAYITEHGFDSWRPPARLQLAPVHPRAPTRLGSHSLLVTLPRGLSHGRFEHDLRVRLSTYTLTSYTDTAAGRELCRTCGIPVDRFRRFSAVDLHQGLVKAATEIVLIRGQADTARLAALVDGIVIEHVVGGGSLVGIECCASAACAPAGREGHDQER